MHYLLQIICVVQIVYHLETHNFKDRQKVIVVIVIAPLSHHLVSLQKIVERHVEKKPVCSLLH